MEIKTCRRNILRGFVLDKYYDGDRLVFIRKRYVKRPIKKGKKKKK